MLKNVQNFTIAIVPGGSLLRGVQGSTRSSARAVPRATAAAAAAAFRAMKQCHTFQPIELNVYTDNVHVTMAMEKLTQRVLHMEVTSAKLATADIICIEGKSVHFKTNAPSAGLDTLQKMVTIPQNVKSCTNAIAMGGSLQNGARKATKPNAKAVRLVMGTVMTTNVCRVLQGMCPGEAPSKLAQFASPVHL